MHNYYAIFAKDVNFGFPYFRNATQTHAAKLTSQPEFRILTLHYISELLIHPKQNTASKSLGERK